MPLASTENLALAAYALAEGAELRRITVSRSNGRRTAVFEIDSPEIEKLSTSYYDGSAIINLSRYRNSLEALKDQLFRALATTETQDSRRKTHDSHRQGRACAPQGTR
jgi:hypothetical protein